MSIDLKQYHNRVFSQFGQDGVLRKIFAKIGTTNKYFVEFGSSATDEGMGNTANLRRLGFDGLLMNDTDEAYKVKIANKKYPLVIECVTAENVNDLFKKYSVPEIFDFLSIDIDGNDYWVWKALNDYYRPRVVCIEANCYIPVERIIVQHYDINWVWKGDCRYGASPGALFKLARLKGYSLVAYCVTDMIFIRDNCIPAGIEFKDINNINSICTIDPLITHLYEHGLSETNSFDKWVEV